MPAYEQLFIDFADVRNAVAWDFNIDQNYIGPSMLYVQEDWIKPILGKPFYEQLQSEVFSGTITPDNQTLIDRFIRRAQAILTASYAIRFIHYKITQSGVMINDPEIATAASGADVRVMQMELDNQAKLFLTELLRYLRENKSLYPLFEASDYCNNLTKAPYRRGQLFLKNPVKNPFIWNDNRSSTI